MGSEADEDVNLGGKDTEYTLAKWQGNWDTGSTGWQNEVPNKNLTKYLCSLLQDKKEARILVPLCGKTVDLLWLYQQGHYVVGIEGIEKGILEFFSESKIEFNKEFTESVNGDLFSSKDGRIKIYRCDLFDVKPEFEDAFDAIWDRGSMVAINKSDRRKYANLMTSLLRNGGSLLLESFDFGREERNKGGGPPHYIDQGELKELFKDNFKFDELENVDDFVNRKGMSENVKIRVDLITKC